MLEIQYILKDREPVRCDDLLVWGEWLKTTDRRVALTRVDGVEISTVFVGIDMANGRGATPVLFETLVSGGAHNGEIRRYATWSAAEHGHERMVEIIKGENSRER